MNSLLGSTLSHQCGKGQIQFGFSLFIVVDSEQNTSLRIHGGLPELFRIHLTQTFVTLDLVVLVTTYFRENAVQFFITVGKTFQDFHGASGRYRKNTVDFVPNFDDTEKEPVVLPSRYPNLLVNGTTGIAVGMATNIPPHNLREVVQAVVKIIDNRVEEDRDTTIDEILPIVKAPDFPTGGLILGTRGCEEAYRTGRGKIRVRACTSESSNLSIKRSFAIWAF